MNALTQQSTVAEVLAEIDREHEQIASALGELTGEWDAEQKERYEELVEERLEMVAARDYLLRRCKQREPTWQEDAARVLNALERHDERS